MLVLILRLAVLLVVFIPRLAAEKPDVYKGELQLPFDLYTSEGLQLEKGRWEIEVRQQNTRYEFIFNKKNKTVARVGGDTVAEEKLKQLSLGVPLTGTIRLEETPAEEADKEPPSDSSSYLIRLSWRVTLRVLGSPNSNEVILSFRKDGTSEPPSRVIFRLFRSKLK